MSSIFGLNTGCNYFLKNSFKKPSCEFFETILRVNELYFSSSLGYRDITISHDDYSFILKNPGEFISLAFYSQGMSRWYFYHALDGRKVFIIQTPTTSDTYSWSWRKKDRGELTILKSRKRKYDEMISEVRDFNKLSLVI
jgi:hypothetical protein